MNTAACLLPELVVLPSESAPVPDSETPTADAPPLADISLKVPRSRDIEVYEQVVFACRSQRDVAEMHAISQPRVHQILHEMSAWMADNTPGFAAGLTPQQRLRLVHFNVTKQLEHQQECLMEAWRESVGVEVVSRTSIVGQVRRTVEVQRPTGGNFRYLHAAGRVSQALLKLAGWTPGTMIPSGPQDSPYWQSAGDEEQESGVREQESGVRSQESEEEETGDGKQGTVEAKEGLSSFAERARNPNLTRAEMDAITAEQEAVYEATKAKLERLQARQREAENTLSLGSGSLGSGPLLPENGERPTGGGDTRKPRSSSDGRFHAERGNKGVRREFLRGEPPVMTIRETIVPVQSSG